MPTSIGDPAAGQRLNIPSLPKDAEIRITLARTRSQAVRARRVSTPPRVALLWSCHASCRSRVSGRWCACQEGGSAKWMRDSALVDLADRLNR